MLALCQLGIISVTLRSLECLELILPVSVLCCDPKANISFSIACRAQRTHTIPRRLKWIHIQSQSMRDKLGQAVLGGDCLFVALWPEPGAFCVRPIDADRRPGAAVPSNPPRPKGVAGLASLGRFQHLTLVSGCYDGKTGPATPGQTSPRIFWRMNGE
jgi:hypothetical protein